MANANVLFIREPGSRKYRPATDEDILAASRAAVTRALSRLSGTLCSPSAVADLLKSYCTGLPYEVFGVLLLDNQHRLIRFHELFRGTLTGTAVYPREVVRAALLENAAAMIVFHNHPSGRAEPSRADETLTQRLKDALALVEVRVLDHLVVAGDEVVSFADRGLL